MRGQRPRISFITVGADVGERDADIAVAFERFGLPHHLVEAAAAAVQMVASVVRRQFVGVSVEREARVPDAVRIASDDGTEEAGAGEIALERVESEDDIVEPAAAIGRFQRDDDRAVGDDSSFDTVRVGQREGIHLRAIRHRAEGRLDHSHCRCEQEFAAHVTFAGILARNSGRTR